MAAVAFLPGCWELRAGSRLVEEQWTSARGGILLGTSRTTRGGVLVGWEFVHIRAAGDTLIYAARPSGQAPAEFRAFRPDSGEVVFENPAHDFPQRIRYRPAGRDSLIARVEGTLRGSARGSDFRYARVGCPGPNPSPDSAR